MFKSGSKVKLVIIFFFFLAAFGLKWYSFYWPEARLKLAGTELAVQVAKTQKHLIKGLGGRDSLGEYDGMLFLLPDFARHGIVMRDMLFPIDVVWFNGGEVVDMAMEIPLDSGATEEQLKRYYPRMEANTILELPAGWISEHGLKIGDMLEVLD